VTGFGGKLLRMGGDLLGGEWGRRGEWVCHQVCWNDQRGVCVTCAPKLDQEIVGLQARAQVDQLNDRIRQVDWTEGTVYAYPRPSRESPPTQAKARPTNALVQAERSGGHSARHTNITRVGTATTSDINVGITTNAIGNCKASSGSPVKTHR
jgi:hypothetical protein